MGGGIGHFRIPQRVPNPSVSGTSPLEVGLAVIFGGRPTDQWRSNTGDAGSEMHMACTARVADATHEPAEHNDEYPYKTSYRQVSVKHMSNIHTETYVVGSGVLLAGGVFPSLGS